MFLLPIVIYAIWVSEPSLRVYYAKYTFPVVTVEESDIASVKDIIRIQRDVQEHFRKMKVYIPLEDIIFIQKNDDRYVIGDLLRQSCGEGPLFIWLPISFRIPHKFQRIYEQCWTPKVDIVKT